MVSGLAGAGCAERASYERGELGVLTETRTWIQNEPIDLWVQYDYQCAPGDLQCPHTEMTVERIACVGCEILVDPTGDAPVLKPRIRAVATVDGPIQLTATVRNEDTGEPDLLTASMTGDHEVALHAQCMLIDSVALDNGLAKGGHVLPFRPCETTRRASDTVVVFPRILTSAGDRRFPFCTPDGACGTWSGRRWRPLSAFVIEPAPAQWANSYASPAYGEFAILPPLGATQTLSLRAPLASGELATASVAVPPLE